MQMPKEEIRKSILAAAKQEFLKKGFEKASVRTITSNAKTSKSNVYNYFKNKDELFCSVVEPTLSNMKAGLGKIQERNRNNREAYSMNAQKDVIITIMSFIYANTEDFKLLLFCSAGSSLAGFKAEVTRQLAKLLADWVAIAAPDKKLTDLFINSIAGFYVGAIERLLAEEITRERAAEHFDEFLKFVYGGWKAVL
jgi:AcrR family transcriptional regulator